MIAATVKESFDRNGKSTTVAATLDGGVFTRYPLGSIQGFSTNNTARSKKSRNSFTAEEKTLFTTNERCSRKGYTGNTMIDGATHMEVNLGFQKGAKGDSKVTTWTDFTYIRAQRIIAPPRTTKGGKFQVATLSSNNIPWTKVVTAWGLGEIPLIKECASVLYPQTLQTLIYQNQEFNSYHRYLEQTGLSQRATSTNDYTTYKAGKKDLPESCYQDSVSNTIPHREYYLNQNIQWLWSDAQNDLDSKEFIDKLLAACSKWTTDTPSSLGEWINLQLENWSLANLLTDDALRKLEATTLTIPQNGFQRYPHQPVEPYTYVNKRGKTITSPTVPTAPRLTVTTDATPTITPHQAVATGLIINTASPSSQIIRQQTVVMLPAMQRTLPVPPYQHDVMQNFVGTQLRNQEGEEEDVDLMNLLQGGHSGEYDWELDSIYPH